MNYIDADKLLKKTGEDFTLPHNKDNTYDANYLKSIVEHDEMVNVSEIQEIIKKYHNDDNSIPIILELKQVINPPPREYAGLTIKEWEQLNKLEYVKITLDSRERFLKYFYIGEKGFYNTLKLLPDPEGFYRAHIGNECPVPGNVKVKIIMLDGDVMNGAAKSFRWDNPKSFDDRITDGDIKAYRILGVSDE